MQYFSNKCCFQETTEKTHHTKASCLLLLIFFQFFDGMIEDKVSHSVAYQDRWHPTSQGFIHWDVERKKSPESPASGKTRDLWSAKAPSVNRTSCEAQGVKN